MSLFNYLNKYKVIFVNILETRLSTTKLNKKSNNKRASRKYVLLKTTNRCPNKKINSLQIANGLFLGRTVTVCV